MLGFSDLLLEEEYIETSAISDDPKTINQAGHNLNETIDGIMQVVKIDAGTIQLHRGDCNDR